MIGTTTENPYFEVNSPPLSRSLLFRVEPLTADDVHEVLRRGLDELAAQADAAALAHLVERADADARVSLNALEVAAALAAGRGAARIELADAEAALNARALRYERDEHYDTISAFIKSVRGLRPRRRPGGGVRRTARGAAQPGPGGGAPGDRPHVEPRVRGPANGPGRCAGAAGGDGPRPPPRRLPLRRRQDRPRRRLRLPPRRPARGVPHECRPPDVAGRVYYEPSEHGKEREIRDRQAEQAERAEQTERSPADGG